MTVVLTIESLMKKNRIKDDEYKQYIESLPCFKCGHKATGARSIYNEYLDEFTLKACRNTAHHVDTEMSRAKNDHRILPTCGHYIISGKGTKNCHDKEHGNKECKTQEYREKQVILADEYYKEYCILKGIEHENTSPYTA